MFRSRFLVMRLFVDDMMAIQTPYLEFTPPEKRPMLSTTRIPVTVLPDPPSMATPASKALTVPSRTVTPLRPFM